MEREACSTQVQDYQDGKDPFSTREMSPFEVRASLLPKPFSPGQHLEVVPQGRPWQGRGREQRKQEGRRSCIHSLLLIILLFLLREAGRSANHTMGPHLVGDPEGDCSGGRRWTQGWAS